MNRFAPASRENPIGFQTREMTVERAPSSDASGPITLAISSEAPVERWDWTLRENDGIYDEILDHGPDGPDLSYVRDGIPFCLDHSIRVQVGLGTTPTIDGDRVMRTEVASGSHPDASWVFADMHNGIRKKVSAGYWPGTNYVQSKDAITGRITRRFFGWMLYEVSSVAVPADYDVGVGRSAQGAPDNRTSIPAAAAQTAHTKERSMPDENPSERGVTPAPDTRFKQLSTIAREAKMPERVADWIANDTSVDDAQREVRKVLIERAEAAEQRAPSGAPTPASVTGMKEREAEKPWEPAEFFRAVVNAARNPGDLDVRFKAERAEQRAQNTSVGADGGWTVPDAVATSMLEAAKTGGEILSRVTERPVTNGNSYKETVVKEEARTNGSRNGGVQHYWVGEDNDIPESQTKTRQIEMGLKKIAVLVKLTEEQIEDGPAMASFINEQAPEELRFGLEKGAWDGSGAGTMLGFMNSGALKTVAIEGTQTIANTNQFIWINFAKMFGFMPAGHLATAGWFINQTLWAKILTATAGAGGNAVPMFIPPGMLKEAPNGAVYGRPVIPVEYASAEGAVGDVVFASFKDYLLATKGGVRQSISTHVEFIRDRQVMKFIQRVDGQPRTRVPITPLNGTDTQSPYVTLGVRA